MTILIHRSQCSRQFIQFFHRIAELGQHNARRSLYLFSVPVVSITGCIRAAQRNQLRRIDPLLVSNDVHSSAQFFVSLHIQIFRKLVDFTVNTICTAQINHHEHLFERFTAKRRSPLEQCFCPGIHQFIGCIIAHAASQKAIAQIASKRQSDTAARILTLRKFKNAVDCRLRPVICRSIRNQHCAQFCRHANLRHHGFFLSHNRFQHQPGLLDIQIVFHAIFLIICSKDTLSNQHFFTNSGLAVFGRQTIEFGTEVSFHLILQLKQVLRLLGSSRIRLVRFTCFSIHIANRLSQRFFVHLHVRLLIGSRKRHILFMFFVLRQIQRRYHTSIVIRRIGKQFRSGFILHKQSERHALALHIVRHLHGHFGRRITQISHRNPRRFIFGQPAHFGDYRIQKIAPGLTGIKPFALARFIRNHHAIQF